MNQDTSTPHRAGDVAEAAPARRGWSIGHFFWLTVAVLFMGSMALVLAGMWQDRRAPAPAAETQPAASLPSQEKARIDEEAAARARIYEQRDDVFREVDAFCEDSAEGIARHVALHVPTLFEPVYARIPAVADWHYSVAGEYEALGAYAAGNLAKAFEARLLDGVDLDGRWNRVARELDADLAGLMRAGIERVREKLRERIEVPRERLDPLLDVAFAPVDLGPQAWAELQGFKVAAVLATKVLAPKLAAIASKLVAKLAAKLAAKTGAKWAASATGAAGAAAACSVVPVVGTALCGVAGGVAAWFAVDAAVVSVSEVLHREAFEAELREAVDAARDHATEKAAKAYVDRVEAVCASLRQNVEAEMERLNRPPVERIVESAGS